LKQSRLKWLAGALVLVGLMGAVGIAVESPESVWFYDLNHNREVSAETVVGRLKDARVVLVGEKHTVVGHHEAQLNVIRMLHESGTQVAVGLEMFRAESQEALDRWVAGDMSDDAFQQVYFDNWNFPWTLYDDIFLYARDRKIPLVGLNVPREITRQVARRGFSSLNEEQRGKLDNVTCRVDREYMEFIRRAHGAHGHGNLNFIYFCEAQMVWDSVMAVRAIDYVERHPGRVLVVLAGTGHARKQAVPAQIRDRRNLPLAVILPEVPGELDPDNLDAADADFIYLSPS
jgi:uncharacterized iron-regulated protein